LFAAVPPDVRKGSAFPELLRSLSEAAPQRLTLPALLSAQDFLMGLLRQLGNALFLRRGLRCGLFLIRREVFAHFLLMLAKRKSTYALGLNFESLNVPCLISNTHVSSPRLRLLFLTL
jgi:hypothetical protein